MAGRQLGGQQEAALQIIYPNNIEITAQTQPLTKDQTAVAPQLINPPTDHTIFLIDHEGPDQPFLHWAVYIDPNGQMKVLQPYFPPTPPKDIHNYIFYTFSGRYNGIIKQYPFDVPANLKQIGEFSVKQQIKHQLLPLVYNLDQLYYMQSVHLNTH